jgi:hypothetical protein
MPSGRPACSASVRSCDHARRDVRSTSPGLRRRRRRRAPPPSGHIDRRRPRLQSGPDALQHPDGLRALGPPAAPAGAMVWLSENARIPLGAFSPPARLCLPFSIPRVRRLSPTGSIGSCSCLPNRPSRCREPRSSMVCNSDALPGIPRRVDACSREAPAHPSIAHRRSCPLVAVGTQRLDPRGCADLLLQDTNLPARRFLSEHPGHRLVTNGRLARLEQSIDDSRRRRAHAACTIDHGSLRTGQKLYASLP